jgi:hypothetical protein
MVSLILRMLGCWKPDQIIALASRAIFIHVPAFSFAMATFLYSVTSPPLVLYLIVELLPSFRFTLVSLLACSI